MHGLTLSATALVLASLLCSGSGFLARPSQHLSLFPSIGGGRATMVDIQVAARRPSPLTRRRDDGDDEIPPYLLEEGVVNQKDEDLDIDLDEEDTSAVLPEGAEWRQVTVGAQKKPVRVDRLLAEALPDQSRSALEALFDKDLVRVDGKAVRKSAKLAGGEVVELYLLPSAPLAIEPEDIPLDVLYEDEHMIAVNKPPHLVVHPAPGHWQGTFVNALLGHLAKKGASIEQVPGQELRPGIVHRLDKGTSGVLLAAKTARAHAGLSEAFSSRRVSKTYLTVCVGNPGVGVEIDEPIGRHPLNRQKMAVAAAELGSEQASMLMPKGSPYPAVGRPARSFVDTLAFDGKLSVVQVRIETGRTHQIRVHLQHRRTPVLGDELYGNAQWNTKAKARFGVERPMLHALTLELAHPVTMQPLKLTAPVPRDLMRVVRGVWPQVGEPGEEAPEWVGLSK